MRQLARAITGLLVNRWQIPAAVAALVVAAVALTRIKPPEKVVHFETLLANVMRLMEAEEYYDAANAAANLLELRPALLQRERAILHDRIAEIAYRVERRRETPNLENVRLLLEHQSKSDELGLRPDARSGLREGLAHEWLNEPKEAIEAYRKALDREPPKEVRQEALQALVRLLEGRPYEDRERRAAIDALLAEEGVSPAYVWWALQHAIQEAIDREEPQRAREMLTRHAEHFKRSDLRGYHDFLWAWLEVSEGRIEEAAPKVAAVDDWLKQHTRVDSDLDKAGFLPAMNLWLRARIDLAEERPQHALDILDRVLTLQSHGLLFVDATIARCQAVAMLERHDSARRGIRDGLARLSRDPAALHGAMMRMRKMMLALSDRRHELSDSRNAVAYLALALDLTPVTDEPARLELLERLGRECEQVAGVAREDPDRRAYLNQAGEYYGRAADLAVIDPRRHSTLLWSSAQAFDRAGNAQRTRSQLRTFVESTASDSRLPPALLQLGVAHAADGLFDEAQDWYRRLIANYPDLEEALRARVLRADALVMLGENRYDEAEMVLHGLLTDDRLSPANQNYKDALFMLCDLLYERGSYARAISRMEEFLQLCEGHPETGSVRFMLADAYRRSAHELRDSPPAGVAADAVADESAARFGRAARLFEELLPAESPDAAGGTENEEQLFQRLALFYRGECLYELNTPDTLEEAQRIYLQAVAMYQGRLPAVVAQVQVVNILLRQGKLTEAVGQVERARWLLKGVPSAEFDAASGAGDRAAWDRYLATIADSPMLRDVFADARP